MGVATVELGVERSLLAQHGVEDVGRDRPGGQARGLRRWRGSGCGHAGDVARATETGNDAPALTPGTGMH
jgi:hypothetical protein